MTIFFFYSLNPQISFLFVLIFFVTCDILLYSKKAIKNTLGGEVI